MSHHTDLDLPEQTPGASAAQSQNQSGSSTPATYTTAHSSVSGPQRSLTLTQALLALTPIEPAHSSASLPSVIASSESRTSSPQPGNTNPSPSFITASDASDASEDEYEEVMEDGTIHLRRRSSAATKRHNSTTSNSNSTARRASQRSVGNSPLTRFRGLSAMQPVEDEAVDEDEEDGEQTREKSEQDGEPADENSLGLGGMITELSRHVSVEAAAGPVALYAPRSRTGSTSTVRSVRARRPSNRRPSGSRVSFPDTVVEHDLARKSAKPDLPRIDSEKTLAPEIEDDEDDEGGMRHLAKSKSRESRASAVSRPSGDVSDDGGKYSDGEDAEAQAQAEQDEAMTAIVKGMSKTRKILLGVVMMMTVFVSVSLAVLRGR